MGDSEGGTPWSLRVPRRHTLPSVVLSSPTPSTARRIVFDANVSPHTFEVSTTHPSPSFDPRVCPASAVIGEATITDSVVTFFQFRDP